MTWTVRPFDGPDDRAARKAMCVELRDAGWKNGAIARELQLHPFFVWRSNLTEEKLARYNANQRANREKSKDKHLQVVRCPSCGRERTLGAESVRRIKQGRVSGVCVACSRTRTVRKRRDEGEFVPLTEFEIYSWARKKIVRMTPEELRVFAQLPDLLPDDDDSSYARARRTGRARAA